MADRKRGLDADIRALYQGPFDEFITARNALAANLRKEKRGDDAAEVKALPKPTPSAWAVNLLFALYPEKMDELLGAGKRARTAQREAVSGRGAESLRETIRAARGLADELRWDAAHLLTERGRPPSRDLVERIAANLQALAFSPAAAEQVARGWLDRDLDPPGFEVLAGLPLAGAPVVDLAARRQEAKGKEAKKEEKKPTPPPPKVLHLPKQPDREAQKREEEARRKQEAAEQARREREAERIRRRVAVAEEKAEKARAESQALLEEAREAESAAAEARQRAEEAERAAARIREKADKAAERLARAEEAVEAAREPEGGE